MGYIGKINADGGQHSIGATLYGTCDTASGTSEKVVTCSDFTALITGVTICVTFTNLNTATAPTLNVNGTGAIPIISHGETQLTAYGWNNNQCLNFLYDGTNWLLIGGDPGFNANTTMDISYAGLTGTIQLYRRHKTVTGFLDIGGNPTTSSISGTDNIGTVPAGWRPPATAISMGTGRTNGQWAQADYYPITISVTSSGVMNLRGNVTNMRNCRYWTASLIWNLP